MDIYVVQPGDTVWSIAARYGVSPEQIIRDNELSDPERLAVGQTLVILFPARTVTVQEGDTLSSIARQTGVPAYQLLRNNPALNGGETLYPGQTLVLEYTGPKQGTLSVNGYAYPYIDRDVLRKTLPYLTMLTIFTYGIRPDGTLVDIDDEELIALAEQYGVAPVMLLSTLGEDGRFSSERALQVLSDPALRQRLIGQVLDVMQTKGYRGLDVDFEYVPPESAEDYAGFLRQLRAALEPEGLVLLVALAPKTSVDQPGLLYEAHDYAALGEAANAVLLMTYEWGYSGGPPMAVAPLDKVAQVVRFAATQVPPSKTFMGIPNYGYNWTLPFVRGESIAPSLSNVAAAELAAQEGAAIAFDPTAMAPYFFYTDADGARHEVWFEDARSIRAKLELAAASGLYGIGYWNIMRYFPQNWLVLNALYDIRRNFL